MVVVIGRGCGAWDWPLPFENGVNCASIRGLLLLAALPGLSNARTLSTDACIGHGIRCVGMSLTSPIVRFRSGRLGMGVPSPISLAYPRDTREARIARIVRTRRLFFLFLSPPAGFVFFWEHAEMRPSDNQSRQALALLVHVVCPRDRTIDEPVGGGFFGGFWGVICDWDLEIGHILPWAPPPRTLRRTQCGWYGQYVKVDGRQ